MENHIERLSTEDRIQSRARRSVIVQIDFEELHTGYGLTVPLAQVIQHDDLITSTGELPHRMGADVTGSARNEKSPQ
jgi:hypothetical protein